MKKMKKLKQVILSNFYRSTVILTGSRDYLILAKNGHLRKTKEITFLLWNQ